MPQGFYELLGLKDTAGPAEVETAYQKQLAALVRRLRHARQQGADVRILESQERALREARAVLGDPVRRRRYDAFRAASDQGLPSDAEGLWASAAEALVDPTTVAALRVVRTLTDLPVGDPFPGVADPAPPLRMPAPSVDAPTGAPPTGTPPTGTPPTGTPPTGAPPTGAPGAPVVADVAHPGAAPGVGGYSDSSFSDSSFSDSADTTLVEVLGRLPARFDPLEELLADLSGTDPGMRADEGPIDPIDRLARDFGYDGRFLKAAREQKGLQLDDLSRATRISNRYLEAIEANGFDQLPAATFVRGYVKEIVRVLELSDRDIVGGYMALFQRQRG